MISVPACSRLTGVDVLKSATPTSYGEVPSVYIMPTHITDIRESRSHFMKFWAVGRYLDTRTCLVRALVRYGARGAGASRRHPETVHRGL